MNQLRLFLILHKLTSTTFGILSLILRSDQYFRTVLLIYLLITYLLLYDIRDKTNEKKKNKSETKINEE